MSSYATAIDVGLQGVTSTLRAKRSNRFKNLPRVFGRHELSKEWIFRGASIDANPGDVVIVLGDEIVQCTTFMRCMCSLLPADEGVIGGDARSVLVPQPKGKTIRLLSFRQAIFMLAGVYGMTDRTAAEHFDEIATMAGVQDQLHLLVEDASPAIRLQLAFSIAMFTPVDLLAFDGTAMGGEPEFAELCIPRLMAARDSGQALLIRTKSVPLVRELGSKVIVLGKKSSRTVSIDEAITYMKDQRGQKPTKRRPMQQDDEDDQDIVGM